MITTVPAGRASNGGATRTVAGEVASLLLHPDDRLFARTLLADGERARHAWSWWTHVAGDWRDPRTPGGRLAKAFAPLLLNAIARHDLTVARDHAAVLRAWRLAEQVRTARFDAIVASVLGALADAHVPVLVVGGCAFAADLYESPAERHCHDLDLVLPGDAGPAAVQILQRTNCVPAKKTALQSAPTEGARTPAGGATPTARWLHASGLPVVLRLGRVHDVPAALDFTALFDARRTLTVAGREVAALDRGHALVLSCLPAFTARHRVEAVRSLLDVARLCARLTAEEWSRAYDIARRHALTLLLRSSVHLATEEAGIALPPEVDVDLGHGLAAGEALDLARERARLLPVLAGAPRSLGALMAMDGGWTSRASIASSMLFPSRDYLAPGDARLPRLVVAARSARRIARWCTRGVAHE